MAVCSDSEDAVELYIFFKWKESRGEHVQFFLGIFDDHIGGDMSIAILR